jgi:hypothetical protein
MELDLNQPGPDTVPDIPPPDAPPPRRTPVIALVIAGLALGGGLAWWFASDRGASAPSVTAVAATEQAIAPSAEPAKPLPPLGQMDIFLRALLGTLSSSPEFVRWLATDDLIRQMARGIDDVSRGESPAENVPVLTPLHTFEVSGRRGQQTIDPASYRRYEPLASAVASLDPPSVARAYRTIQPRLDEAYRALGRSEGGVDTAVHVALQTLISTPALTDPIRIVPGRGATYAYADPAIEQLTAAQKQLIRMGPANQAKVQARLREIKAALESAETH